VKYLIRGGADINVHRRDGKSPLNVASERGFTEIVRILLDNGADIESRDNNGCTALYNAVDRDHQDGVALLIQRGADVNAQKHYDMSPLNVASKKGFTEIVRILLDNGADTESRDDKGRTALFNAVCNKRHDVVALLIERGADVNTQRNNGRSPLTEACDRGVLDIVSLLLKHGSLVNMCDITGWTPLFYASCEGHITIVKHLLDAGADVSLTADNGESCLVRPAYNGHIDVVLELVSAGADVNLREYDARTPLMAAVQKGHADVLTTLLDNGADTELRDNAGRTTLFHAIHETVCHGLNVVQLLVHHGAKVNVQNVDGKTPLHVAVERQQSEVVVFLLNAGADVGLTDVWRNTPLHYLIPGQLMYDEHEEHVVKQTNKFQHLLIRNAVGMTALSSVAARRNVDYMNKKHETSNTISTTDETDLPRGQHINPLHASTSVISCLLELQHIKTFSKMKVHCGKESVLTDCYGNTPLHHAVGVYEPKNMYGVSAEVTETIEFLVKHGADVNAQNNDGLTPLHVARGKEATEACLRHADDQSFTITDKNGRNFWHLLFISKRPYELASINWPTTAGSDASDHFKRTPLHYACMKRWDTGWTLCKEFVEKFSEKHINKQDIFGRTALHYVAMDDVTENIDLRKLLETEKGADNTIQDNFGMTANKYERVHCDYITKVRDLTLVHTSNFVHRNFPSIARCMQQCFSDRSHYLESSKAELRTIIRGLRACNSISRTANTYQGCRFDYSDAVYRKTAPFKKNRGKQVKLLTNHNKCEMQSQNMFSAIQSQVKEAMQHLAKEISDKDKRFACEVVPVGSTHEGTKIGCCDEFDFNFVLTWLNTKCKVCYSPESPPGFVLLKASTPEFDEDLFDSDGILNTRILTFKFETLVKQILSSLSFCEATVFQSFESYKRYPQFETTSTKVNIKIELKFARPVNGCHVLHDVSVDVVPAVCIDAWWPDDMRREDLCQTGDCLIVFTQPQVKYPWIGWTEPHGFISFAQAESRLLRECPRVIKAAVMVVKRLSKYFCRYKFFSSHVIKTALFWCLDEVKDSTKCSLLNHNDRVNEDELLCWVRNILQHLLCFAAQDYVPSYFLPKCHQPVWLTESYLKEFHMRLYQHGLSSYTDLLSLNEQQSPDGWLKQYKSLFIFSHLMYWSVLSDDDELKLFVPSTINPLIENDVCTTLLCHQQGNIKTCLIL